MIESREDYLSSADRQARSDAASICTGTFTFWCSRTRAYVTPEKCKESHSKALQSSVWSTCKECSRAARWVKRGKTLSPTAARKIRVVVSHLYAEDEDV